MTTSTPNTRVSIRSATHADREFLDELADRLGDFEPPKWRTADEIAAGDRRALLEQLDTPSGDSALFIAMLDGVRAGCLLMWTLEDYFIRQRHGHISVLAVTKAAEGHGVG